MSTQTVPVLVEIAVGGGALTVAEADLVAAAAQEAGVTALRLLDTLGERSTVEATLAAAYLAGRHDRLGFLADASTTRNAPYNLARRVLSVDRAAAGRLGLLLHPGSGDEVSDATTPDTTATVAGERWSEYAGLLARLWESFPREALLGDAERALLVDDALIAAVGHEGRYYRVAGPLDGPTSRQGRPVVAADARELGWDELATGADVVVVDADRADGAAALGAALERVGRRRSDVALLGRIPVAATEGAGRLLDRLAGHDLDGLVLVPPRSADGALAVIRHLVPQLSPSPAEPTLRAGLGLAPVAARLTEAVA
jgi:hypothetical protein